MALAEVLSSIQILIDSISLYQELRSSSRSPEQRNSDLIKFMGSWAPLLEQLRFSKDIHDSFQDFENNYRKYKKQIQDKSPQAIVGEWENLVKNFFERKLDNLIALLPNEDEIEVIRIDEDKIPLLIKPNMKLASGQYKELVKSVRSFDTSYKNQEADISNLIFRNFDQYNVDIEKYTTVVINRADKVILNLVPILISNYQIVMDKNS